MSDRPNILFLMTDQMQGRVLEPGHPCATPLFDRLAGAGVRLRRAYTPNAVCSPARASLMTGLLPHSHGVLEVIHCVDEDQCNLRVEKPHWAQRLVEAGYRTGYFGKWHVERSDDLARFGWQVDGGSGGELFRAYRREVTAGAGKPSFSLRWDLGAPTGYREGLFYGVTDSPPEVRGMGITADLALRFLKEVAGGPEPWCCFASVTEPHDPFVAGQAAFDLYDVEGMDLPPNADDGLSGRPGIYRKAARVWAGMTDREKQEAQACYFASITEIDGQFERLVDFLERAGALEDTVVVLTSDHGELLGAHGLYCKNFSGFEEVYNIPMVVCGPGVARGAVSEARVGLHDLCPTLLELAGLAPIGAPDSRSFAAVLRDPEGRSGEFSTGFAEYHGTRFKVSQRILWDEPWKLVFNGFDFDELYNLDEDPYEMHNLAEEPAHTDRMREMMAQVWRVIRDTGDHTLLNSHYPILRVAPYGPEILSG